MVIEENKVTLTNIYYGPKSDTSNFYDLVRDILLNITRSIIFFLCGGVFNLVFNPSLDTKITRASVTLKLEANVLKLCLICTCNFQIILEF